MAAVESWDLEGVDEATREQAQLEADRLGISLADFLTMALEGAPEPDHYAEQPMRRSGAAATRQRLDMIERRMQAANAGLEGAVASLDQSLCDLAERFDDANALNRDSAGAIEELRESVMMMAETAGERLDAVEALAHGAAETQAEKLTEWETRFGEMAEANSAMKHAIVSALEHDLEAFEIETRGFIDSRLSQAKLAAEAAAQRAEAAAEQALESIRNAREALEERIAASEAQAQARIATAEAELLAQNAAFEDRVSARVRAVDERAQDVTARVTLMQTTLTTAIDRSAADLKAADATLAQRIAEDCARIEKTLRADLQSEAERVAQEAFEATADLRLDMSAGDGLLRDDLETLRTDLGAEIMRLEANAHAALHELRDEGEAADAAMARDIENAVHAASAASADLRRELGMQIEELRNSHLGANARLRLLDEAVGADSSQNAVPLAKRLSRVETEIADRAYEKAIEERIARIEAAVDQSHVESAVSRLGVALQELAERPAAKLDDNLLARFDGLGARLSIQETVAAQAAQSRQDLEQGLDAVTARMTHAFASAGDAMQAMERRITQLQEQQNASADAHALAAMQAGFDARIDAMSQAIAAMANETRGELAAMAQAMRREDIGAAIGAVEQRVADSELRQRDIAASLSNELARLSAVLEHGAKPAAAHDLAQIAAILEERVAALEQRDIHVAEQISAEVGNIRQRIEDRFAQIEQRSVRAIERLGETVALMGQKLNQRQDDMVLELVERVGNTAKR